MIFSLKSRSRSVHEEHKEEKINKPDGTCTSLTVWRKSLLLSCNGFTVIDSKGNLVYRVDNYIGRPKEVILMDGSGKPVLTVCRRRKLGLADNWVVYEGEVSEYSSKNPIWCVRKHINILQPNINVLAHVYHGPSNKRSKYVIEGSYGQRSCKVLDYESRKVVAEIKMKEAMMGGGGGGGGGVSFGLEVFILIVWPGFDPGFAMAIVLLLDQMFT